MARDYRIFAALGLVAPFVAWIAGGSKGLQGMMLGLGAAGFGVTALVLITNLVGTLAKYGAAKRSGTALIVLAFLLKIPLFLVVGGVAIKTGGAAIPCFAGAVMLVYFSLVAWAAARS